MAAYKELDFEYDILGLTTEYGLDGIATPQVIAFAIELYDAGILTEADVPEFPVDTGDRFFYLVERIARREGIGDVLAEGVYGAARRIGRGAEEYDHNSIKKMEQISIKLGMVNFPYFLMYATGEDMDITRIEGSYPEGPEPDREKRKEFVEGWVAAPGRFKKMYLEWEPGQRQPIEDAVYIVDWNEAMHYIDDAIGMCAFLSSFRGQFGGRPPYHLYNLPDFITLATGMAVNTDKLWEVAERNRTLVRALNVRRGLRRADEAPPADHWKKRDPEAEEKLLDAYYEFKGWNNDGIPKKETLDRLELNYVSADFMARGILADTSGETSAEGKESRG
jgi:aldehyde:ferredoxin oxidoreductase